MTEGAGVLGCSPVSWDILRCPGVRKIDPKSLPPLGVSHKTFRPGSLGQDKIYQLFR